MTMMTRPLNIIVSQSSLRNNPLKTTHKLITFHIKTSGMTTLKACVFFGGVFQKFQINMKLRCVAYAEQGTAFKNTDDSVCFFVSQVRSKSMGYVVVGL